MTARKPGKPSARDALRALAFEAKVRAFALVNTAEALTDDEAALYLAALEDGRVVANLTGALDTAARAVAASRDREEIGALRR